MSLATQLVHLPIRGGKNEAWDALALEPGQGWVTLNNLVYDRAGVLRKRHGYTRLLNGIDYSGGQLTLGSVRSLHPYQGRLVAVGNPVAPDVPAMLTKVHNSTSALDWRLHDLACPAVGSRAPVQRSSDYSVENPQAAVTPEFIVYSWISNDELFVKIVDRTTGAVVRDESAGYGASAHRTVVCGNYVMIVYTTNARFGSNGLHVLRLDPGLPFFSLPLQLSTEEPLCFDAVAQDASNALVAWVDPDVLPATKLTVARVSATDPPVLGTNTTTFSGVSYFNQPDSISVAKDNTWVYVAFVTNTGAHNVYLWRYDPTTLVLQAGIVPVDSGDLVTQCRVAIGCNTGAAGGWLVWAGSKSGDFGTYAYSFDATGALSDDRVVYNTSPYCRPWYCGGGYYCCVTDDDGRGYALVRLDVVTGDSPNVPQYCGALGLDEAPGITSVPPSRFWPLPAAQPLDVSEVGAQAGYLLPLLVPVVARNMLEGLFGLDAGIWDFDPGSATFGASVEAQRCLALGGAYAGWFDGQSVVEQGWHHPPKIISTTVTAGTGNIVGAGASSADWNAYNYLAVYEWLDEQGNWHRSEPSAVASVGVTLANTNATIEFRVKCTPLTARGDGDGTERRHTRIAIYRTKANTPEVYYRLDDPTGTTYRQERGVPDVLVSDSDSDTTLESNAYGTIYTAGDALHHQLAPPARALAVWKNRLWLVSGDDGKAVWYSKQFVRTEAPAFNPILQVRLDDAPDDACALAALGGSLLVFTPSRIYYLTGEPPNDTGADNRLIGPELVSDSIGCTDSRSVVTFPGGVLFFAQAGIHLVTSPQAPPQFVGAPVRDATSAYPVCRGVVHDPSKSRIIWSVAAEVGSGAGFVVWDYLHNAWSTWVPAGLLRPAATAFAGGLHYYADDDGVMEQGGTTDDGAFFGWKVITPWLRLNGPGGFERVRHVVLLVDKDDHGQVSLSVRFDEESSAAQTATFNMSIAGTIAGLPRPGLDLHLSRQKGRSMQIEIEEVEPVGAGDGAIGLYGITLEAGVKQGRQKLPATNKL